MKVLKNSQGNWDSFKLAVSVVVILVLPLIGVVYNNMANAIEKKADCDVTDAKIGTINKTLDGKVDNTVLQQMLLLQQQQQKMLQDQISEQKKVDKETLKTLQELNINMRLLEQKLKEP